MALSPVAKTPALVLLPLVALLAACGDATPPPIAPPPPPPAPGLASAAPVDSSAPATPPDAGSSDPTVLTDEQKQRDAALAPLVTTIVDAYPNWNGFFSTLVASFSPDGKRIVFGSQRDGLPEIYLGDVAHPDAPPLALTAGPERAIWGGFTPDGSAVLLLRDTRGDENHAIWRVNPDGTGLVNLTPGESLHRGEPIVVARKPKTMFYSGRAKSEAGLRVFTRSLDGTDSGPERAVYSDEGVGALSDVSPDGTRLLVVHARSQSDQSVAVVDVATGKERLLYPPAPVSPRTAAKVATIHATRFSQDGRRVYVSTDDGRDASVLVALDARTGKEAARFVNEVPTSAMRLAVPGTGHVLAVVSDLGNHGEVRMLDAGTLEPLRAAKVPMGDVQLGAFTQDGRTFSILVSLPNQPADVFAVDVASGVVTPLRADRRPGLDALPPVDAAIDTLQAFDGLTIPVNRYLPHGVDPSKRLPTLAIFHGGPASSYAIRWNPYARVYVALGYAVIEPNVRGSSGFGRSYEMADDGEKRADWLKDLESVNAWARAQPWCDPDRIVVWGQSYGGYTTLMALTRQPTLWRAGVDLYGVANMRAFLRTTDPLIRSLFVTEFGDVDKDAALLDAFSPMRDVDKIVRPLFVYAGQNDPRVPRSESDAVVRAVRSHGVPSEYMVADNEGHTVDRRETRIELLERTARFLSDALR
jgi:dipeptidyl aminopeptidase/acylaminoacyl peptidase